LKRRGGTCGAKQGEQTKQNIQCTTKNAHAKRRVRTPRLCRASGRARQRHPPVSLSGRRTGASEVSAAEGARQQRV
jgi:hypothetical protein